LTKVVERVLDRSRTTPETVAVDLGCGSGQVTLPLARRCARVLAVDVSAEMIELLGQKAAAEGAVNLQLMTRSLEALDLEPGSVDLVTTNYALHHLRDADKRELVERILTWLRPGGQLVIGDLMLGRGGSARDREVIVTKVRHMAARGPAGWWRILKNLWRFSLRVSEKPLTPSAWEALVTQAGFDQVQVEQVVEEACVLSAQKPSPPTA
jgi:SAM-dependent methyltransferase